MSARDVLGSHLLVYIFAIAQFNERGKSFSNLIMLSDALHRPLRRRSCPSPWFRSCGRVTSVFSDYALSDSFAETSVLICISFSCQLHIRLLGLFHTISLCCSSCTSQDKILPPLFLSLLFFFFWPDPDYLSL